MSRRWASLKSGNTPTNRYQVEHSPANGVPKARPPLNGPSIHCDLIGWRYTISQCWSRSRHARKPFKVNWKHFKRKDFGLSPQSDAKTGKTGYVLRKSCSFTYKTARYVNRNDHINAVYLELHRQQRVERLLPIFVFDGWLMCNSIREKYCASNKESI